MGMHRKRFDCAKKWWISKCEMTIWKNSVAIYRNWHGRKIPTDTYSCRQIVAASAEATEGVQQVSYNEYLNFHTRRK
jgi:hypothetical protein